jgi:TolB-like protein
MKTLAAIILLFTLTFTSFAQPPRVLLARFDSINSDKTWLAKSLQSSLAADLTRQGLAPIAWPTPIADSATAIAQARNQNAAYVIIGSTQSIDTDIRVTGQIIEVATGRVIGGLKSTGALRDIFAIQDDLASQIQIVQARAQPQPIEPQPPVQQPAPQPAPPANDALAAELAKAQALNRQLEQAIRRLEDAADRAINTPEPSYVRTGVYSPIYYGGYYPVYNYNRGYTTGSGLSISGAYRGDNFVVGFRYGTSQQTSRGASTVGGNYVRTGPMVMQPAKR